MGNKYLRLIKWRLSLAVAFSASAGFFLATGDWQIQVLAVFLGVFLMSGGAAGLNQVQERRLDQHMGRTAGRPLPKADLSLFEASVFILLCLITGSILLFKQSWIAGLLGLSNLVFYNVLYTPLKRKTIYAILPGGVVGAIPPLIGWTAAGGDPLALQILFLATLLFLWQIPHFWLLVIRYGKEYESAGFQSISMYLDGKQIRRLIFSWILISSVFLASFTLFGIRLQLIIGLTIIVLNALLILAFYWYLFKVKDQSKIRTAFIFLNVFLMLILILLTLNALI